MEYEPLKDILAIPMRRNRWFRKFAYRLFELGFLRVRHVNRQLRQILKVIPEDAHILDAAFGFGPYSYLSLKTLPKAQLTGYEINSEQVADCTRFFIDEGFGLRSRFYELDLLDLNDNNKFDLAIAVDVMEHIEDDVKVLSNFRKSLKPGGILFIHTPAGVVDSRTVPEHNSFVGEHVRDGYHPQELKDKLYEAGFSKVQIRFTYGRWGMWSWWLMQGIPFRLLTISKFMAIILPFYYLLVFPFANRFMLADLNLDHLKGGGLLAKAWV